MAPKKIGFDPAKATVPVETNEGTDAILERGRTNHRPQPQPKTPIGIKIPTELYNDFERLKVVRKYSGETLRLTDVIVSLLSDYIDGYRDEMDEFDRKLQGKP